VVKCHLVCSFGFKDVHLCGHRVLFSNSQGNLCYQGLIDEECMWVELVYK
jgi:hypothetical protein